MDPRPRLRILLDGGCFLPAARDLASLMLAQADRRAMERASYGYCASYCTAPVVTTDPEPLCAKCARMLR